MLETPLSLAKLPSSAKILTVEKAEEGYRAILWSVDPSTGAFSIYSIAEDELPGTAASAAAESAVHDGAIIYHPIEEGREIKYLTSDILSFEEAAEASVGVAPR